MNCSYPNLIRVPNNYTCEFRKARTSPYLKIQSTYLRQQLEITTIQNTIVSVKNNTTLQHCWLKKYATNPIKKTNYPQFKIGRNDRKSAQSLQSLVSTSITEMSSKSFAKCTSRFNGERNHDRVEEYITAITIFKKIENIGNDDAVEGLGQLLVDTASTRCQGVK